MCTAVVSIEAGRPVLLAGFRDELTDRPWQPPASHWPHYPGLVGGRDLQAGGTWLAVAPSSRKVSCVLNGTGKLAPADSRRSRGELPLMAAVGDRPGDAELSGFDPFRLIVAEPGHGVVLSWDGTTLIERDLPDGLHFVVNSGYASDLAGSAGMATDWAGPDWQAASTSWHAPVTSSTGSGQLADPTRSPASQLLTPGAHGCRSSMATASESKMSAP
jgi:hypothetical protein